MKKLLCVVLCFMLLVTSLVGCAKDEEATAENGSSSETSSENSNTDGTTSDEPLKISMTLMGGPKVEDSWLEHELESKLNVDFEWIMLPGWGEKDAKINLMMSDPETMPDVIWYNGLDKEAQQWKEAGLVIDILPYLRQTEEQNILKYYGKDVFFHAYSDGGMYRLGGDVPEKNCDTTILRKDWLDKLGLKAPTTVEEFVDVARAFTFDDPDGNGVDDTFGFGGSKGAGGAEYRAFYPIFAAYGAFPDSFQIVDGKIRYAATLPGIKDALIVLRDMYAEGIMDPSVITGNEFDTEVFSTGNVGMFYRFISFFNPGDYRTMSFSSNNPEGELMQIAPIKGPDGFGSDQPGNGWAWCNIAITSACEDPQGVINVLDKMMGEELFMLRKFGEEGTHYEMVDGMYKAIADTDKLNADGINSTCWILERKDAALISNTPEVVKMFADGVQACKPMDDITVNYKDGNRPVWQEYASNVNDLRDQIFYGIIAGTVDISEFDVFVQKFYDELNGAAIETEAQEFYDRQKEEYEEFSSIYEEQLTPTK